TTLLPIRRPMFGRFLPNNSTPRTTRTTISIGPKPKIANRQCIGPLLLVRTRTPPASRRMPTVPERTVHSWFLATLRLSRARGRCKGAEARPGAFSLRLARIRYASLGPREQGGQLLGLAPLAVD